MYDGSLGPPLAVGERRIRVHTLCLAVSSQPAHVYAKLNVQAITTVLAKMGEEEYIAWLL